MLYLTLIYFFSFLFWGRKLNNKQKFVWALLPFVIINFTRFGYGADYFSYERIYHDVNIGSLSAGFRKTNGVEPLFVIVNYLADSLGLSYHVFAGVFTSVISFLTIYWLLDYSPYFEWSVLLYFVMHYPVWTLSALRQGISMILLLSLFFSHKESDKSKKILVATVSLMFHLASIIVPILYFISKFNWNKKHFLFLLLLVPMARFVLNPNILMYFENVPFFGRYVRYLTGNQVKFLGFSTIVRLIFFVAMYVHYDLLVAKYPNYREMFNFVTLSFILYLFLPFSTVIATRVTVYGYFLTIIVFPMIAGLYKDLYLFSFDSGKFVKLMLSLFAILSFYNEFDKMRDRSGYIYSLSQMNLETVFNKNYNHFNKQFVLHNQINNKSLSDINNLPLFDRVYAEDHSVEAEYKQELDHYSVYFKNKDSYGVINEEGHIVMLPFSSRRSLICEDIVEDVVGNKGSYQYSNFRNLKSKNLCFTSEVLSKCTLNDKQKLLRKTTPIMRRHYNLNEVSDSFLNEYNLLPVTASFVHEDSLYPKIRYLEIQTTYNNYYTLINENDEFLVKKWYNSISPINSEGLIFAKTEHGTDIINSDGEVIWLEGYVK